MGEFTRQLDALLAAGKRDADIVQLTGGEPTIHPDIEEIIATCFAKGVEKLYLVTGVGVDAVPGTGGPRGYCCNRGMCTPSSFSTPASTLYCASAP